MDTPAQRIEKILKELFAKFLKTPFVIPAAIAIATLVYLGVWIFASGFCLSGLITPLAMLGVLWWFGFKEVKKMLIIGAVACLVFSVALAIYLPYSWMDLEDPVVESDDGRMIDGGVTPMHGTYSTMYNFTVTVNWTSLPEINNVSLIIGGVGYFAKPVINVTMTVIPDPDPNATFLSYYHETTVTNAMNVFGFGAVMGNNWTTAGELGPVTDDAATIAVSIYPATLFNAFTSVFPIYALFLLMVWWTRRARRMRTEAYERAIAEREKEREGVAKEETKVPSLSKAMGLDKDEGFVCSECGADVPGDAKVCPKCGEKFD